MTGSVPRIWPSRQGPDIIEREFMLDVEDHLAARRLRAAQAPSWAYPLFVAVLGLFVALLFAHASFRDGDYLVFAGTCLAGLLAGALLGYLTRSAVYGFLQGFWRGFLQERQLVGVPLRSTVGPQGIEVEAKGQTAFYPWASLDAMEEDGRSFYFWISRYYGHIWPKRIFASDDEQNAFRAALTTWTGAAPVWVSAAAGKPASVS